jgi:hypothetical protein
VFIFDSLSEGNRGGLRRVTKHLKDYLGKEAKDKLNVESTSHDKVQGREAKVR